MTRTLRHVTPPTTETTNGSKGQIVRRGFHLIWRSLKAEPLHHSIALAGAIVYALSLVGFTRALSWATDTVIIPALGGSQPSNLRLFTTVAVVMGVAFLRGIGAAFRRHFLAIAEYRTEEGWRHDLFDHYLNQPLSTLRRHPVGRLIAHIDSDVNTAGIVLKPLAFAAATVVLAVVGMASLFEIHPWFGFLGLVLFPSLAVINQRFSNAVEHPAADVQRAVGDVTSVAHESFDGAMMVKTLGRQSQEVARFRTQSENLKNQRLIVGRINTTYQPLLRILPNIGALAMLTCGAALIDQEAITFGELIGAVTLLSVLAVPLRVFAFFLQSMPPSVVALERIDTFLNEDDRKSHQPQQSIVGGNKDALLDFDDVAFFYPALSPKGRAESNNMILDQLAITLNKGEVVALVGSTGSGKTTIAELAAGLISPSTGSIRRQPGATIALALQESFLFDASISANLTLGASHNRDEIVSAAVIAQAAKFISELPDQYETVIGERGVTLSGGQRQRLALARALLRNPDLLVLDDATSAIDPVIEASILKALRKQDLTMLMIANRISTIRLADRVLFLNNQRIEASGSHHELLELPAYRTLLSAELKSLGGTV